MECESRPGLGCLVFGTRSCSHRSALSKRLPRWLHIKFTIELWWVIIAVVPVLLSWKWFVELL